MSTPENCQDHQKRGKPETMSQPRGAQGDMTSKCDGGSWMGSSNGKRTLGWETNKI